MMDEYDSYQFDVSVQPFTKWLAKRLKYGKRDGIDNLAKRLITDTRIPAKGSLGTYRTYISVYFKADQSTFEAAWQEMRVAELEQLQE